MATYSTIPNRFIALVLAADILCKDKSIVFSYNGKKEAHAAAQKLSSLGINNILKEIESLKKTVLSKIEDTFPFFRKTYLLSQINALEFLIKSKHSNLRGKHLLKAVNLITGLNADIVFNEETIRKPLLQKLKKYNFGDYHEYKEYRSKKEKRVTKSQVRKIINDLKISFSSEVIPKIYNGKKLNQYFDKTKIRLESPRKGYPPCYFTYDGNGRSRACMGEEHLKHKFIAVRTIMHELIPGHMVSSLYREMLVDNHMAGEEIKIDLLYSAETPINEGIAEWAPALIPQKNTTVLKHIEIEYEWDHFFKKLLQNVWFFRQIEQSMTQQEAVSYICRESGINKKNATWWENYIKEWQIYYPSYPLGLNLIEKHVKQYPSEAVKYLYLPKTATTIKKFENHMKNTKAVS